MAHAIVTFKTSSIAYTHHAYHICLSAIQNVSERALRRAGAWLLFFFLLQGELGMAWDIQWHFLVGRDRFWTPPHTMIYIAVGGAGLVALAMVLIETLRYRRGFPDVNDCSTICIFRVFHAPLGFIMMGFGSLIDLIAAPFDNWWHQLYGIDINLWSPFHLMGALGGILGIIGIVSVFASEAAIERQHNQHSHTTHRFLHLTALEWGVLGVISSLLELTISALTQFTSLAIGPLNVLTYPLPLAFGGALCLISVVRFVRKSFAATLTALLLSIHVVVTETFVPWATRLLVAQMRLTYRLGRIPTVNITALLLPLLFLLTALVIDSFVHRHILYTLTREGMLLIGICIATLAIIVPVSIALILAHAMTLTPDITLVLEPRLFDMLFSLPFVMTSAIVGAIWGKDMGNFWHWNKR